MGKITILPETTKNPISLIGQRAGVCWNADTSDSAKNYKRGIGYQYLSVGRAAADVLNERIPDAF